MSEPVYFVVQRHNGRPSPALVHDIPPRDQKRLEYITRLDTLPGGKEMVHWPLAQLWRSYLVLKDRGKLPPRHGSWCGRVLGQSWPMLG